MEHLIWMIIDQKQTQLKIDVEVDPDTGTAQIWKVWDCLENRQIELSGAERLVLADKLSYKYLDIIFWELLCCAVRRFTDEIQLGHPD